MMLEKVQRAKDQFAKLQQAADEALWEDVDEEEEEEVGDGRFVMEGRVVKQSDVHKMLHLAKATNLMEDKSRVRFFSERNNTKAGKVKISDKTIQET